MTTHKKNFDSWSKLNDFSLDILVDNDVIPYKKMYVQYKELLKHHTEVIEQLIEDLEEEKGLGEKTVKKITDKDDELPYDLLD